MTTEVEQTTNDLLHFTGRFNPTKLKLNKEARKKKFLRATSFNFKWSIKCSDFSLKTHNPIRAIVDGMKIEPNQDKPMIALSIGDPTTFGNLPPADQVLDAMKSVISDGSYNGYGPSVGFIEARQAVAEYSQHQGDISASDVILCSGCSCALDLCIAALAGPGQNILIPKPGFSIYATLAEGFGIEVRSYNLIPEKNWEIDLDHLETLIDLKTAAVILTNPSNPCGSVFSKQHILEILQIAERHYVPIIADEIYEHFVFPGNEYYSVSSLSKNVPVLSCGGITKRFLVPGWRTGWIIIHDRHGAFLEVRKAITNLSSRILGSNSLVQGALPAILKNTPQKFYDELVETLQNHANIAYQMLKEIPGLVPIMPSGAMYMMVGIEIDRFPAYNNELDFVQDLVREQSVFCLPGKCFNIDNFMRIVLTVPRDMMVEACNRIREFCEKHYKSDIDTIDEIAMNDLAMKLKCLYKNCYFVGFLCLFETYLRSLFPFVSMDHVTMLKEKANHITKHSLEYFIEKSWKIKMTSFAMKTENPLRKIWEGHKVFPNPRKEQITLQIGDPTVFGNFPAFPESVEAIRSALNNDNFAYTVSAGGKCARQAVADYVNKNNNDNVTSDDVFITNGCSCALETCFRVLINPGENILIPSPTWNYTTWISGSGIEVQFYKLNPDNDWEIDLEYLESLINEKTKAILVNNPGNPCGNVFSKQHMLDIIKIAERHCLPIISDEVYEFFTFPGVKYYSFSSLSKNVPILACSGLTKRFLMPGIRMGWIVIHDRNDLFHNIRLGLANAAGRNFWPNSTVQLALPNIIKNTSQEFFDDTCRRVYSHALSAYNILKTIHGLKPIMPKGSMYMMVGIELKKFPEFTTCLEFTQALIREQSVATFPGYPCFYYPGFFRIVLTVPENLISEACKRIKEFCEDHRDKLISVALRPLESIPNSSQISQISSLRHWFQHSERIIIMSNTQWNIKPTYFGIHTVNPLRKLWQESYPSGNPNKSHIVLQPGDPTAFGNFPTHPECIKALQDAVVKDTFSYYDVAGIVEAREAVAKYSKHIEDVKADDVILTSGVSMAVEMCIKVLVNPEENILVPSPGWNYITYTVGVGIKTKFYNLLPGKDWEIDLEHLETKIDEKTKAILINNPGNPCGNVFSKEHILDILEIAERHKLPIISDEVYEFITFPGVEYHSFSSLSKNVPVFICSGLTKRFLMPGIRMGWIILCDRGNKLTDLRPCLKNIEGRNFGPSTVVQLALPNILKCTPQEFLNKTPKQLAKHANIVIKMLKDVPGIQTVPSKFNKMLNSWDEIKISDFARLTINPLRKFKFERIIEPNPSKSVITLQLGDPTVFGNFPPPKELLQAFKKAIDVDKFPYNVGKGKLEAREAIVEFARNQGDITADDILLASGCSHAIEMCILTLASPGENILIPLPCYNYKTWTDGMRIETKGYNLNPLKSWDIDLEHLESLIDEKTRAIVVNSPGNPCGNVFSKEHILEILEIAERHKLPIISDEVYEFFTFPGVEYHSFSSLSKNVPILACSALSKRFLIPGIRMGWIIVNDRHGAFKNVRIGLENVTGRILGPNSAVQLALPEILRNTPREFFEDTTKRVFEHAKTAFDILNDVVGLNPIMPKGSMYMMIRIDLERFPMFSSCLEFTETLIREESVLTFPGVPCFNFHELKEFIEMSNSWDEIKISDFARLTIEPLWMLQFERIIEPNPSKSVITLQIGDPTAFGNFPPPKELLEAFKKAIDVDKFPYNVGKGKLEAREAIVEYAKNQGDITPDDILLASGCSHAIEMCILSLASPGENILIPLPCYNYKKWTDGMGIETKGYNLNPLKSWDIDLEHLESLIDEKTRAIVVNSPGNPCGNVFSKEHILEILEIAERHKLPIISDEVYEFFTFPGVEYHSFSSLSKNVPILACSALSKRFLIPGIRMGWIIINDRHGAFKNVRIGLENVTGRILGPNSAVQLALPEILRNTPREFFEDTTKRVFEHAKTAFDILNDVVGLNPIMPKGSMYMMIRIDLEKFPKFSSCLEFTETLIREESVLTFPGVPCFNFPGFFRIVLTVPDDKLKEACLRIKDFCARHINN
ncbi:CLUMA_CG009926, isoform A [Clunio marinus]|uniref:Tyrosine aminotransferase n=1 Tax=Clunio marinus TaxID=568069 RepID=A0A1J1IBC9_9DIPT|nr:CLUMA_CG009926, isoform A [Clunio marinus]